MIWKQFYAHMEWAQFPLLAMILFIVFFALLLLRTFGAKRVQDYQAVAALPLADDQSTSTKEMT